MVKAGVIKGMKAICDFMGLSETTVLGLKRSYPGMPMNKVAGEWWANQSRLEEFNQDLAAGNTEPWLYVQEPAEDKKQGQKGSGA